MDPNSLHKRAQVEQIAMPDESLEQAQLRQKITEARQFMHGEMQQCLSPNRV